MAHDSEQRGAANAVQAEETSNSIAAGKKPRTAGLPAVAQQAAQRVRKATDASASASSANTAPSADTAPCADTAQWLDMAVRPDLHTAPVHKYGGGATVEGEQQIAAAGVSGQGSTLPYSDVIQKSFGHHDVSGVRAHTDAPAQQASNQLGAQAYATGTNVAFGGTPSLHTAAHEAAHVVQQRAGLRYSKVGVAGDQYEAHADRVADLVVAGQSAETALDEMAGGGAGGAVVQKKKTDIATKVHSTKSVVFNPYKKQNITPGMIKGFLDTFVNERGESLKLSFGVSGEAYFQVGWFPAYAAAALEVSLAYEMAQDFTHVLAANVDLSAKGGLGKATKKASAAAGVSLTAGYAYQYEFANSTAVAGSIYNIFQKINHWINSDKALTDAQKARILIPTAGSKFLKAGAKKELEVTSLGGGVFAQGEMKTKGDKSVGGGISASWSSTRTKHKDKQGADKGLTRHSSESNFSLAGEFKFPWKDYAVGGSAALNQNTVFGDPNVNMNGKFQSLTISPAITVPGSKVAEFVKTFAASSPAMMAHAVSAACGIPVFADLPLTTIAGFGNTAASKLPASAAQITQAAPKNPAWEKTGNLTVSPVLALKWREQERDGQRSYALLSAKVFIDVTPGFGGEKDTAKGGLAVGVGATTRLALWGTIGTESLFAIRQTYIDAPEKPSGSGKKPAWRAYRSSNKESIAGAIYNCVYNSGKGPARVSSAGSGAKWRAMFGRIKGSGGPDVSAWVQANADSLIADLEGCFNDDQAKVDNAEVAVRAFISLLSDIKESIFPGHAKLSRIIATLRKQHALGGASQVKHFLALTSSFGADPVQIIQSMGPYWGRAATSWFDRWGVKWRAHEQRATEPKLPQYQRMAKMAIARMKNEDGLGVYELFAYARNDSDMQAELKTVAVKTALSKDGFAYESSPQTVLLHCINKAGWSWQRFVDAWDAQTGSKLGQRMGQHQNKVGQILAAGGYTFGVKMYGFTKDGEKLAALMTMYEQRGRKARAVLVTGPGFFGTYDLNHQEQFYALFEQAHRDATLSKALEAHKKSYPDSVTKPLLWLWNSVCAGIAEKHVKAMFRYGPYFSSLAPEFASIGHPLAADYKR